MIEPANSTHRRTATHGEWLVNKEFFLLARSIFEFHCYIGSESPSADA